MVATDGSSGGGSTFSIAPFGAGELVLITNDVEDSCESNSLGRLTLSKGSTVGVAIVCSSFGAACVASGEY